VLAENVPVWPAAPPLPTADWGSHARYAPSQGIDTLLVALRERELQRGVSLTTESLLVTNGGLDGLALIARHLAATGVRRAVCGGPILLSVADLFGAIGLEVIVTELPVFTDRQAWSSCDLRPSDLVYLNTPHNPTGACLDADAVRTILDAQSQFGFSLVMDLVYDSFVHDPAACASPPALVSDWRKVYALNSFSKNYGAPGLRVGWLIAGPEEIGQLTARLEWERIAVCTDTQYQAARLCSYGNTPLVKRVQAGRELVLRWAKELGVVALPSQGGTQLWADLLVGDTEVLADELMAEHGLIMTTGANYYPADRDYIRIPYGADPALLLDSLQTIAAVQCRLRG
jgi:beta-methylarginine biosynthesis bifunctional aminotransferase